MTKSDFLKVLDADYPRAPVQRREADRFVIHQRGSARLVAGRYRTETEQAEFIDAGLSRSLPYPPHES